MSGPLLWVALGMIAGYVLGILARASDERRRRGAWKRELQHAYQTCDGLLEQANARERALLEALLRDRLGAPSGGGGDPSASS